MKRRNNKETRAKISYEPEADVLTWEITGKSIDYAKEVGNIVVHFTRKNTPVLVEILEASKFFTKAHKLFSSEALRSKKLSLAFR